MKSASLRISLLSLLLVGGLRAADQSASSDLRDTYVAGVRLISETRNSVENASSLLTLVENGADQQAIKVSQMERGAANLKSMNASLAARVAVSCQLGKKLKAEKSRLDARFAVLADALDNDAALLEPARKALDELTATADRSGSLAVRRLADRDLALMTAEAARLHRAPAILEQTRMTTNLEYTLLEGLQQSAQASSEDLKKVAAELTGLEPAIAAQRASIDKVRAALLQSRSELDARTTDFNGNIERFRVVQVAALRRWLTDGMPQGDIPSLAGMNLSEAGFSEDRMVTKMGPENSEVRPSPDETHLRPSVAYGGAGGRGLNAEAEENEGAGAEALKLHNRVVWHLSMLGRLNDFLDESIAEAGNWRGKSERWRSELASYSSELSEERSWLTGLRVSQDMLTTTISLLGKQADAAGERVRAVNADIAARQTRLAELTSSIEKLSKAGK